MENKILNINMLEFVLHQMNNRLHHIKMCNTLQSLLEIDMKKISLINLMK